MVPPLVASAAAAATATRATSRDGRCYALRAAVLLYHRWCGAGARYIELLVCLLTRTMDPLVFRPRDNILLFLSFLVLFAYHNHVKGRSHYGKSLVCRVSRSVSCAFCRTHGKEILCRVPRRKRTAKKKHTAKFIFCRVHFFLHTANSIVCRVLFLAHGKVIIFFHFSPRNFFYPLHTKFSTPC